MPSLALTNPDMILPNDGERQSSTPSPPSLAYLSSLNNYNHNAGPSMAAQPSARSKKSFSRPGWTHEELRDSRRLSDIGEELSPARLGGFADIDDSDAEQQQGLDWSPVIREQWDQRNDSAASSSSSTVSAGSRRALREQTSTPQNHTVRSSSPEKPRSEDVVYLSTAAPAEAKPSGDDGSSAILSSEAERILENAKKRLTLMEGNLNRARSSVSVRMTPSPSPSAAGGSASLGTHSPGGLYRSISRTDRKSSSLRRQSQVPGQDTSNNRHSRVHSETNFPSESTLAPDSKRLSRSVSAMGASSSTLHNDERTFQYDPKRAYLTHRASISSMSKPHSTGKRSTQSPQSLDSHEEDSQSDSPKGLGISGESESSPADFSPVYSAHGPPSRAQSQLQVRDLQYHMKGLHIKISSLKVKAQEDNLRRRSLQSLRTPSPLSAADHWYANALELHDGRNSRGSTARRGVSSEYAREQTSEHETARSKNYHVESEREQRRPVEQATLNLARQTGSDLQSPSAGDYEEARARSVAESMYEDAEEGEFDDEDIDRAALDEILREPLDEDLESPLETPSLDAFPDVPHHFTDETPHEEREDAFDYEHFILHSALGNYTRQLRPVSTASSAASGETTRPTQSVHSPRSSSAMSDSTVATFATATEGENFTDDEDELDGVMYWDRRFNHELRTGRVHSHHDPNVIPETDRSETPRADRDDQATPVEGQPSTPRAQRDGGTDRPSSAATATPTQLASSLVSTVRAASSTPSSGGINEDDTQMLEQLFQSLGDVCSELQAIMGSEDPDMKAARVLRRRLDAARRVLDGELDA
ncbi:hypothetical protein N7474_000553 [Penicillium riverlandense]|uniref:uncharacterized protein n=1 Tax=Penicillium riverlandense TaxID=1903569 RepID=UPI002546E480|nr:uncharacterized protein N7474_000553 [Penicillium riverlandense]KAJ5832242.1 hypothetical protein N7474_000553 [Penicillium riverlandense]